MSVTLSELSLRNAKRQAKDYLVYFVTVVMAAALLYSFNALTFSQEVKILSEGMKMLSFMIALATVVVVCVFGWLVAYATRFMLLRRGRELGTYLLIGLENRQVARLFFLENLAVGGCALALGTVLGGLLYQAFRAMALALFKLPYTFSFGFSLPALGLTLVCFGLIYLFALRRSRKYIRKAKIHDLIYADRQNEGVVIQTGKKRRWIFGVSILLGVAGTFLIMVRNLTIATAGAGCLILFLFGFFLSFASGVPAWFDRRPARKYRGVTLLVFRTLTAKLATMGVLMATISMVLTATLISEGTGLVFRGLFEGRAAENACFDLYLGVGDGRDPSVYLDYIHENIPVEQSLEYQVYLSGGHTVRDYIESRTVYYYFNFVQEPVLRWSDYAALRAIAGYRTVELKEGQYLFHCMTYLEEVLKNYREPLTLGDVTLQPGGVYTEHLSQSGGTVNGRGYILVVPDEAVEGLPVHHWAYAAKTVQPVTRAQFYDLWDINERTSSGISSNDITTRAQEEADVASQTALCVFPLYYLALSLTMTAATILTIQQLSESERYKRQFTLLQKLGMNRREMARALRTQFTIYYALPAVPPVLIGVPFILHLAGLPEPGVMVGASSPGVIVLSALSVFFMVYAVYIVLAYTSLKRNVLPA
ncbi:ABC transporter permease [Colidextribacter sp. OB.20]|uniref:FtsX-like permease family protein n=1 Tax=Colidextribacter sp. OB.20 TaxID=2304568 RepID=UPI001FAE36A8|nr:ABC transporter permease [Colidextribacter sp. OB.20]